MFLSDLVWQGEFARGASSVHIEVGVASLLGYVGWALAALHPSVEQIEGFNPHAEREKAAVLHRRRLALLLLCAVVPSVLLVVTHGRADDSPEDLAALLLVIAGVPILTVARLADLLRSLRRTVEVAEEAHADLAAVIDASPIPICVTDHEASVLVWNEAAEELSGYSAAEVVGQPPPIMPAEDPERVAALYQAALDGAVQRGIEIKLLDRDEQPLDIRFSTAPLEGGRRGVVVLFEDVTEQKENAEKIEYLASHDALTGLPNRRSFVLELSMALARSARGEHTTLLLCDVDNFKLVNDAAGHPIGDRFLKEIADRLSKQLRPNDSLARLSGDEFAILLHGTSAAQATDIVERLLENIRDYRLESRAGVLDVTCSVGVYELRDGETPDRAFRRADDALYEAKELGKNQQRCWKAETVAVLSASRGWSPRIKEALYEGRVDAFLQPIVTLRDEEVAFHEALCRLRRPDGSYIEPGAFLPHAERLGLLPSIDRRMLENVAGLLHEHDGLRILVNLAAASFDDERLLGYLHGVLETVPTGTLGVEVTEHAMLSNLDRAGAELQTLKSLGAVIAIDDFGTGFTSFEHLRRLPADLVKVGNGFVQGLGSDALDEAILDGIVATARALSIEVVAEGVETRRTARLLGLRDISYAQGYLYGRPAPAADVLRNMPSRPAASYLLRAGGPPPQRRPARSPSEA